MGTEPKPHPKSVFRHISIEGLEMDATTCADREVRNLSELICRLGMRLQPSVEISVQLTMDMAAAVDRFNAEHGISAPPYNRSRPQGIASGITLTMPSDAEASRYVIVMDATLWSEKSHGCVVYRTHGLAYLLGRIINRHDITRVDPVLPEFQGEYEECLWHNSRNLCSIFDDSIFAIDICNHILRDGNGNPPVLTEYFGDQNLLSVSEFLDQLCIFATIDVQLYRVTAVGLDDLYPIGGSIAGGLLQAVTELIALFGSSDQFDEMRQRLSCMNGFGEFLEPIWPHIVAGCDSEDYPSRVQGYIAAFTTLFARLGLRIEDNTDGGLYVHVHEPVLCTWQEGEEAAPR